RNRMVSRFMEQLLQGIEIANPRPAHPARPGGGAYGAYGLVNRPMKRMAPLRLSRNTNANGWSAVKVAGGGAELCSMMTAVAAAASVPASLTSTNALCTTAEMNSLSRLLMPLKSAPGLKARFMPNALSWSFSRNSAVNLNFGSVTATLCVLNLP